MSSVSLIEDQHSERTAIEALTKERDALRAGLGTAFMRNRPPSKIGGVFGTSGEPTLTVDDAALVRRIAVSFQKAQATPLGTADSMWLKTIDDIRSAERSVLLGGDLDKIAQMLRNPRQTRLFYGFDELVSDYADNWDPDWWQALVYDCLVSLTEAIGVTPLFYPEGSTTTGELLSADELLERLDGSFGFKVRCPNVFQGEIGLLTSRGVLTYRTVQALYQAWRMFQLVGRNPAAKILEIGAGLGRTAYFARQFGICDYTIIDLPLTGVAQAYYLGRLMGENEIVLFGEPGSAPVSIFPPASFLETGNHYDLIANIDSLTEMARTTAQDYWSAIKRTTSIFLSINHEFNPFSIREIITTEGTDVSHNVLRYPYWMRRGYVEEIVKFSVPT